MATEKLFYQDVYAVRCEAVLAEVLEGPFQEFPREADVPFLKVVPDQTVLFPEGGGQPCDTGRLITAGGDVYPVFDTRERPDGGILHSVRCPAGALQPGEPVTLELDWIRRFDNMQRHSGEHILSGAFYRVCGGGNKGFHMGENYITIDIDLGGSSLTKEQLHQAEELANQAIWQDVAVETRWFPDAAAASVMPTRKPVNIAGPISIVTVGDPEDPFDCVACCGTHVRTAGQIGLIKIYRVESNRGMNRVYFDCGRRALLKCREDSELLREVSERFSAGNDDLIQKLDTRDERESSLRAELAGLSQYLRSSEAERISAEIHRSGGPVHLHTPGPLGPDDGVKLGFSILERCRDLPGDLLLLLYHENAHTVLLFAKGSIACGSLVKTHAFACGGRGGGRPDNARALFPDKTSAEKFLAEVWAAVAGS